MNLAWIVAVLRPRDVAPHPNFDDAEYETKPEAWLAALVLGEAWRLRTDRKDTSHAEANDGALTYAKQSLQYGTIRQGVNGLIDEVLSDAQKDLARASALALIAASAAAEMDDYPSSDSVLESLIDRVGDANDSERLVRSAVLQQYTLRLRDSGRPYLETNREVVELLDSINVRACSKFDLSPGVASSSADSLAHIVTAIRQAAWSLAPTPWSDQASETSNLIPSWQDQVRAPKSEQLLRIRASRASTYAKFVDRSYKNLFRSSARTFAIGGPRDPDLFSETLMLELLGHGDVYAARKELAQLRLVQSVDNRQEESVRDALRLLRQAGAQKELDLAVEKMRGAGPLWALSEDARQILVHRVTPSLLRAPELRVLRGAAEVMTPDEAARALSIVMGVISSAGPSNIPGKWQRESERLGSAWLSASALANSAGKPGEVAELLLAEVQSEAETDELRDRSISRALRFLDWQSIPIGVVEQWSRWLSSSDQVMDATKEVASMLCGQFETVSMKSITDLNDVALHVNVAINGVPMAAESIDRAVSVTRKALSRVRAEADRGRHTMWTISAADVAAGLIVHAGADLWVDLADFLTDVAVERDACNTAFDRLARERPVMPAEVATKFQDEARNLLAKRHDEFISSDTLDPYPSALRFLACYGILEEMEAFTSIAQLAGNNELKAREQAARTVAAVAETRCDTWLLALAAQLSHDAEATVKGMAGRALVLLSSGREEFSAVASKRLTELLSEDGLLIPLMVLRAIDSETPLNERVTDEVVRLRDGHPSRLVRREAGRITETRVQ